MLGDLTQRDIALIMLLVFRLKKEGIIGETYHAADFVDVLTKMGDYSGKATA